MEIREDSFRVAEGSSGVFGHGFVKNIFRWCQHKKQQQQGKNNKNGTKKKAEGEKNFHFHLVFLWRGLVVNLLAELSGQTVIIFLLSPPVRKDAMEMERPDMSIRLVQAIASSYYLLFGFRLWCLYPF